MTIAEEGQKFLSAFAALRDATDDSPKNLADRWENDQSLQAICDQLYAAMRTFEIVEEWSQHAFTTQVHPNSVIARREYEDRWQETVDHVANREILFLLEGLMGKTDSGDIEEALEDKLGNKIAMWREEAAYEADSIVRIVDHAEWKRENDDFGDFEWVDSAVRAWDRLTKVVQLDISGALWRRRAVPHILIPAHVSGRYGATELSLYRRLHQAERAFIFGAPLAALALQRAVLEEVLKKHWGAGGRMVATAKLPELSWDARADRLKNLANDALHNGADKLVGDALDRAIIENFGLLRLIIEGAPERIGADRHK